MFDLGHYVFYKQKASITDVIIILGMKYPYSITLFKKEYWNKF